MALVGFMVKFDLARDDWPLKLDTYRLLRDLCYPKLPKYKSYEELCKLLTEHLSPQVSVRDWHAQIKKLLAVNCNFGSNLNSILRDKFVTGLSSDYVLDKVCEKKFDDRGW
ncbi:hypothetical protein ILUMI_13856 [Ignelater luminosus]|uniref:Uncharacterized protein n=1 Tax=Ignelater luminosus TaxID=2038154 RepID=A0A8K0G8A2_IGNLU|nr:hypothetical protein ILUMI_13856 [Ignelater luminosus]